MLKKPLGLLIKSFSFQKKFGFIGSHEYIRIKKIYQISRKVGVINNNIIHEYERLFCNFIGEGECVSFSSGRMAFYSILKAMKIQKGDEILIQGATCSVMINAIIRCHATPVYVDMDESNYGTSIKSIEEKITPKTRVIVAQHSFGIPCQIRDISELAKQKNIYLIEDCALTFGSTYENVICGNFGDAAIFSTDRSKPISTVYGGMAFSNNKKIIQSIREIQKKSKSLSKKEQKYILRRFIFDRFFCKPRLYNLYKLINSVLIKIKYFGNFPNLDFSEKVHNSYPYPSKLPTFLALIGLCELENWKRESKKRIKNLQIFLDFANKNKEFLSLPSCYLSSNLKIVPSRIAWTENNIFVAKKIKNIIDKDWIWFKEVIQGYDKKEKLYYSKNMCKVSEEIGPKILNIPINQSSKGMIEIVKYIEGIFV